MLTLRKADLHRSVSDPVLDTVTFLNEVTGRYPDAISFAPGRPYDGFFQVEHIFGYLRRYLDHLEESGYGPERIRDALFQYGPTAGRIGGVIADWLGKDEGIDVRPEAIVVTAGCQEAMVLAVRTLISGPADSLLVSSPCYVGITGVARILDVAVVAVPEAAGGFNRVAFEAAVRDERGRGRNPRAFYVTPDHSNPSGATMSHEARLELLDTAARLGVLVLEDSPYRLISPGHRLPTLKALDDRGVVVQLGSFAKTLFPGVRVGYVVADQRVEDATGRVGLLADELARVKSMVTNNTSPITQAVVAGMLLAVDGRAADLTKQASAYYGETMRATLEQLAAAFPTERRRQLGVRWTEPSGGFFLSVEVPFVADDTALTRSARDFGVVWTPMSYFHPDGGGARALRLSTSYLSHDDIVEGVARFARFVHAEAETVSR